MSNTSKMNRRRVEALIDDMLAESFPASDPPTWDTAAEQVEQIENANLPEPRHPDAKSPP
jgi:hypothetical protein